MDYDLDEMEKLAHAATQGPWQSNFFHWGECDVTVRVRHSDGSLRMPNDGVWINGIPHVYIIQETIQPENARHIAATNPTAILALISDHRALQAQVAQLEKIISES